MTKVALLIGVSDYDEPSLTPLPSAEKDIQALQAVLQHPDKGGFAEADITVLTNPTRQQMEEAIYHLFANRQKDDLVLFYFSGHGVKDESGKLYLASRHTRKDQNRLVKPTAVAASVLHENMAESRSKRQVLVFDCCFSGAIAHGLTVKDDGKVNLQAELGGKGRAILTSSTSTQYSFEQQDAALSVYTRYLVEGLETGAADRDGDGKISVDELHEYVQGKVQEAAPAMTPEFYPVQEGHRIWLARAPQDDPVLKYRQEVQRRANQGQFTIPARRLLNSLRRQLGVSDPAAEAIEAEVLRPYREYQRKLQEYEETLRETIKTEYPLSDVSRQDLQDYQAHLGLREEDVAPILARVLGEREAVAQVNQPPVAAPVQPQPQTVAQPQQQLTWTQQHQHQFVLITPQHDQPQQQPTGTLPLTRFQFEVVRVNDRGQEVNRQPGQAELFVEVFAGFRLEMVAIPSGEFLMGSPDGTGDSDEHPQHRVKIAPFFMGKYPVTQAQWQAVAALPQVERELNPNPANFKGENRPVECVSWYEAVEFCQRLSRQTGKDYRLPSEAEWEYACRAGTTTPFYFGETITPDLANYDGNYTYGNGSQGKYLKQTTDVGSYLPNAFGLYDLHGNVWEWCADRWHDNYQGAPTDGSAWITGGNSDRRMLRGGSWYGNPWYCRSAFRFRDDPDFRDDLIGFRLVCFCSRTP